MSFVDYAYLYHFELFLDESEIIPETPPGKQMERSRIAKSVGVSPTEIEGNLYI